ncbi:hypothetical protein BH11ARM2_BH11ARM2_24500 [soil metagenome]
MPSHRPRKGVARGDDAAQNLKLRALQAGSAPWFLPVARRSRHRGRPRLRRGLATTSLFQEGAPWYTDRPGPVFTGDHPSRDDYRGWWTDQSIQDFEDIRDKQGGGDGDGGGGWLALLGEGKYLSFITAPIDSGDAIAGEGAVAGGGSGGGSIGGYGDGGTAFPMGGPPHGTGGGNTGGGTGGGTGAGRAAPPAASPA